MLSPSPHTRIQSSNIQPAMKYVTKDHPYSKTKHWNKFIFLNLKADMKYLSDNYKSNIYGEKSTCWLSGATGVTTCRQIHFISTDGSQDKILVTVDEP